MCKTRSRPYQGTRSKSRLVRGQPRIGDPSHEIARGQPSGRRPEAEEALRNLKAVLTNTPILVPSTKSEALLLYVAATTQVASDTVVVERREEGHSLPIQRPVYFISEVLSETKTRYPKVQKLLYVVVLARRKLCHYFESQVTVVSFFHLGEIIQSREASGRVAKWVVELMGETLSFAPRKAIKYQILADFLAEWTDTQLLTAAIQADLWTMYFDGSLMKTGAGTCLLFISPLEVHIRYVIPLHFAVSNNLAEYEALSTTCTLSSSWEFGTSTFKGTPNSSSTRP
jgi:hypothetical protein